MQKMGYLNVGITKRCNLKCNMCDSVNAHDISNVDMSYEQFKELMEMVQHKYHHIFKCETIAFAGYGENLLNKDFIPILKYASEHIKNVLITTNGTLLTENIINSIFLFRIKELHISMTGSREDIYSHFQGYGLGRGTDKVLRNVKNNIYLACKIKKVEKAQTQIILRYIVNKDSWKGIFSYILFGKRAGVDCIYFYRDFHNALSGRVKKCEAIGETFSIDYNGAIMPCCEDFKGEVILGHIFTEEGFKKHFNELKKRNNLQKNMPARCSQCRHMRKKNVVRRIWERPVFIYFCNHKIDWSKTIKNDFAMIRRCIYDGEKLLS